MPKYGAEWVTDPKLGKDGRPRRVFGKSPGLAAPLEKERVFASTRIGPDPHVAVRISKEKRERRQERRKVNEEGWIDELSD